jgi:hypothetical protein
MGTKIFYTGALFAEPSFVGGAARVLDLGGTFDRYNISPTPADADHRALVGDWNMVGQDLREAIEKVKEEK